MSEIVKLSLTIEDICLILRVIKYDAVDNDESGIKKDKNLNPYFGYGVLKGDTKKSYIERQSSASTFAVLHDNEWYEKGSMCWFGESVDCKEEKEWDKEFDKIIASLNPDDEVTIVDCHI